MVQRNSENKDESTTCIAGEIEETLRSAHPHQNVLDWDTAQYHTGTVVMHT